MTAPPLKGLKKTCADKKRYPCEITARAGAMFTLDHNGNIPALYVYKCDICGGWHLTKRQNSIKFRITRKYGEKVT